MVAATLLLVSILRVLVEVAGLALLGQGAVGLLAGSQRETNPIYQLFRIVTAPALRILAPITPRFLAQGHRPWFAFFILFTLWILLAAIKRGICTANGLACFT